MDLKQEFDNLFHLWRKQIRNEYNDCDTWVTCNEDVWVWIESKLEAEKTKGYLQGCNEYEEKYTPIWESKLAEERKKAFDKAIEIVNEHVAEEGGIYTWLETQEARSIKRELESERDK